MLTEKDLGMSARVAVLMAALVLFLEPMGVVIPVGWAAGVPLAALIVVAFVRLYVLIRGPANTTADEALDAAEDAVARAADVIAKKAATK